ncbi:MAG: tRNA (adenosine(37)-N6)-threonylcarbamoyltransferase complex dimerization subunit type 1 TsaB [Prevotella sp.]|nr:tRNA (adenosine(37)-N6)-threonylcarbamoyltransferase complex dimerization subunit type 1 TsaB [Prevotella sp.]
MACILHIETSTDICSVAVSKDGMILFDHTEEGNAKGSQASEKIGTMVDDAMKAIEEKSLKLDAVAVSSGPGSYTGLRIGVSMAKGIAYGRDAKLIAIPTLELLCVKPLLEESLEEGTLLCPMLDARRMEVFAAIYDASLKVVRAPQPDIVDGETYKHFLNSHKVCFFGNGAEKCMEVISHSNALYIPNVQPLAKNMMPLAEKRFYNNQFEDVAYFTPDYLKAYQAKLPKNLLKS